MYTTVGKIFSSQHFVIFFVFFARKHDSPMETIRMKCQILFFEKIIISLSSAELAQSGKT